jgi:hypothetical protein
MEDSIGQMDYFDQAADEQPDYEPTQADQEWLALEQMKTSSNPQPIYITAQSLFATYTQYQLKVREEGQIKWAIYNKEVELTFARAVVKELKTSAIMSGKIDGKNEDIREAQSRTLFGEQYVKIDELESELSQMRADQIVYQTETHVAKLEVDKFQALIDYANMPRENIHPVVFDTKEEAVN